MDVLQRDDLPFPRSLPEFQQLFPDEAKCAAYMEKARWGDGFVCPHCHAAGDPFRIATRPGVLRCRKCRHDTGLTVGTVMERSHMPLSTWFWAAYLVASQTPGISAVQFQRQLGLSRYETAFGILHKLRAGMVRPNQDRIGGKPGEHVEIDETWVGGRTRGEGQAADHPSRLRQDLNNPALESWLIGIHHGVSHQHLQAYLNEFTFRFNRRFYPFNAFRSLLGIAGDVSAPTFDELYSGEWEHPTCCG